MWRREEMGASEWEEKPGGEELYPDAGHAQTGATHPSSSHAPHRHPPTGANGAEFTSARAWESSRGQQPKWGGGWFKRGSEFLDSPTSAACLRPRNALSPTQDPISRFPSSCPADPASTILAPGIPPEQSPAVRIPALRSACGGEPNQDSQSNLGSLWCGAAGGEGCCCL